MICRNGSARFCECSAVLFRLLCFPCSTEGIASRVAVPQLELHAGDHQCNLVQVPFAAGHRLPAPDLVRECRAELRCPMTPVGQLRGSNMADDGAPCARQFVHHAQAPGQAEAEPDGVADDLSRKAVAGATGNDGRCHPARLPNSDASCALASSRVDGAVSSYPGWLDVHRIVME